ncbi:MAG: hypothetical protein WBI82_04095 [Sphaerochaeta sp.]
MPPFPPQGAGYLTLLSQPSLGNGTMVMVMLPLLSLRWGINWFANAKSLLVVARWKVSRLHCFEIGKLEPRGFFWVSTCLQNS